MSTVEKALNISIYANCKPKYNAILEQVDRFLIENNLKDKTGVRVFVYPKDDGIVITTSPIEGYKSKPVINKD